MDYLLPRLRETLREDSRRAEGAAVNTYLLVDCAQERGLSRLVQRGTAPFKSLFDFTRNSNNLEVAPILVQFDPTSTRQDNLTRRLLRVPAAAPVATLLESTLDVHALGEHLSQFMYVADADEQTWMLAFWDSAVLASLFGGDDSQFVPGPILTAAQRAAFLAPIATWVYVDRRGTARKIPLAGHAMVATPEQPLRVDAEQIGMLGTINWVDQVLNALCEAKPQLRGVDRTQIYESAVRRIRRLPPDQAEDLGACVAALAQAIDSKLGKAT